MNLIFLNRYFYPDHSATSQMLSDLAFDLASEPDARVAVITSRMKYDAADERLTATETIHGVTIHRVWSSRFGRAGLAGRAIDYATFYVSAGWMLWRLARSGDIVVAKTDPPMLSVVAAPIAKWRGAKLINWLQDVFPEVAQALGVGNGRLGRLIYPLLLRIRNRSLRQAAANVVLGSRMSGTIAALGAPANRIHIIANWSDGTAVYPIEAANNRLLHAWGLDDAFVVGYSGNLGRAHDITTLLDAIAAIESKSRSTEPDRTQLMRPIAWLFIGGGALTQALAGEVARRGLKSVHFQPYQPREKLAESLSAADVHIVSLRPNLEGLIVPSKFYGIAAAGRPAIFIGDRDGEISRLIAQHKCGLQVDEGDSAGLAQAVLGLAADPAALRASGARAREAFDHEFQKPIAMARWRRLLAEVSSTGSMKPRD